MSGELTTSLPKGGAPGQVLTKVSYDNYKVDWKDPAGGGGGTSSGWILPTGCIVLWSGSESAVPDGFALCNGQNGTPDLRDRFVLGSGTKHSVGDTGGAEQVTLTVEQMPIHGHYINTNNPSGTNIASAYWNSQYINTGTIVKNLSRFETAWTGGGKAHNNMPPYYVLAYIMKI